MYEEDDGPFNEETLGNLIRRHMTIRVRNTQDDCTEGQDRIEVAIYWDGMLVDESYAR